MPTGTQRNFRKQMKEIEKEQRRRGEVDKYRPPKRVSFSSSRQKSGGINYLIG